jgi:hypothetical protein
MLVPGALHAECAQYVTSAEEDGPASGTLVGEKTVSWSVSGSGLGWRVSYSESYAVGEYEMADGTRIKLKCSDYTPA